MNTEYVREFLKIAETGSYAEAAEQLYVSTSALSRHIFKLEEELERSLFDRNTKNVSLTDEGARFIPYARRIVETADAFFNKTGMPDVRLQVAAFESIYNYELMKGIPLFTEARPNLNLVMKEAPKRYADALEQLRQRKYDVCILQNDKIGEFEEERFPGIQRIRLITEPFVVMMSKQHVLSGEAAYPIERLAEDHLLWFPSGLALRLKDYVSAAGTKARMPRQLCNDFVTRNIGIAIVSETEAKQVEAWVPSITHLRLIPTIEIYVDLFYCSSNLSPETAAFAQHMKQYAEKQAAEQKKSGS